ncbi:hypothetical protein WICPIJ_006371 [Wickerhamomyces pijperi]|uniref:S1 motif domain-containing protein n=1 Tax=Wickerhamomyces pijperi TaxID=599730 RepID=A0A9P8Q2E9_WICPI|nr:hypothetical protein WICPIJ_006371 [Wickerhamomyces pijperi]
MAVDTPTFVVPGQPITPTYQLDDKESIIQYIPGNGSVISEYNNGELKVISATILGNVQISEEPITEEDTEEGTKISKKFKVQVISSKSNEYTELSTKTATTTNHLPKENDTVLVKVLKISLKQANVEIIAIENSGNIIKDSAIGMNGSTVTNVTGGSNGQFLSIINNGLNESGENFRGIIRIQDIRATERDKLKMVECFKPNDIIRAKVLSIGDGQNYYLTTNENEFGVVFARANNGNGELMYPIDWQSMIVPSTGDIELRKCANPFEEQ